MKKTFKIRLFLSDEQAVSEEYSLLPALSIVMVGFALFIILLAQTYSAYADKVQKLQYYQTAESILQRLTSPDCFFIKEGGLIDLQVLQSDEESLSLICSHYTPSGIFFWLRLAFDGVVADFPESVPHSSFRCVAVSRQVGVFLNEAQTQPGVLTIMLWEEG